MIKLRLFLVLALYMFETNAQQITGTGDMTNISDGTSEIITYKKELHAVQNRTKYTIFKKDGTELYEVVFFSFTSDDGNLDSIQIRFDDKQADKIERKLVKFSPEDSKNIVTSSDANGTFNKNNDAINDKGKFYDLLFSIDNKKTMFVTLNQFRSIVTSQLTFELQTLSDSIQQEHRAAVARYKRIMAGRKEHEDQVTTLSKSMENYANSKINTILEREKADKMKRAIKDADDKLRSEFEKDMNGIFIDYFRNIPSFTKEIFDVSFTFSCNGYKKISIDTSRDITFINGPVRNWLRDSFILNIQPRIESAEYETLTEPRNYPTLQSDFRKRFEDSIKIISPEKNEFIETINQIDNKFNPYLNNRSVSVPTLYSYNFKYKTEIKEVQWRYNSENDKLMQLEPQRIELDGDLKQMFKYKKLYQPGSKKYTVQICTIYINGKEMGKDMRVK